jgi:hypothetical protein
LRAFAGSLALQRIWRPPGSRVMLSPDPILPPGRSPALLNQSDNVNGRRLVQ